MRPPRALAPLLVSVGLAGALAAGCGDDSASSTVSSISKSASSVADQAVSAASSTASSLGSTASSVASSVSSAASGTGASSTSAGGTTATSVGGIVGEVASKALGELVKASIMASGKPYDDVAKIKTAVDRIPGSPSISNLQPPTGTTATAFQVDLAGQKACLKVTTSDVTVVSC